MKNVNHLFIYHLSVSRCGTFEVHFLDLWELQRCSLRNIESWWPRRRVYEVLRSFCSQYAAPHLSSLHIHPVTLPFVGPLAVLLYIFLLPTSYLLLFILFLLPGIFHFHLVFLLVYIFLFVSLFFFWFFIECVFFRKM